MLLDRRPAERHLQTGTGEAAGGADNLAHRGRRQFCGRGVEVNRHEAILPVSRQLAAAARGQRALHPSDVRQQPQRPRQTADRRGVGRAVQRRRRAQDDLGAIAPLGREPARQEVLGLLEGEPAKAKLLSSRLPAHCASPMTATTASTQPARTRRR